MAFHNIEKYDRRYAFLKRFVNFNFKSWFRKVTIKGKENIPDDAPVIFAPNHQNALMDALAILASTEGQPVFLARSDIFKKPLVSKILTFLKILPIYRIRDGYGNLKMNNEIIQKIIDILSRNHSLIIFPEGNHGNQRKLRPFKKGISRIAFQTEEAFDYQLDTKIIPVGLDYSDYYKFNHELLINFGKPIDVKSFIPLYKENPSKAHRALIEEIASQLKPLMVHIDETDYYDSINELREIYKYRMKDQMNLSGLTHDKKLQADQTLIDICQQKIKEQPTQAKKIDENIRTYTAYRNKLNLREWVFQKGSASWLSLIVQAPLLIAFFPVFLYGLINHLLPSFIPYYISGKMKDPQFWSSIRSTLSLITFPLFYIIQSLIVLLLTPQNMLALVYLASLPVSGFLAYRYSVWFKKWRARLRFNWFKSNQHKFLAQTMQLRNKIMHQMDEWTRQHLEP